MSAMRSASSTTTWSTSPSDTRPDCDQVLEPAGARHDELDAGVEGLALRAVAHPAVHRHDVVAALAHERAQLAGDLLGQLPGRGEHEGGGTATLRRTQPGDERQAEGERLARAGGRAAGDVAAGEGVGDDGGLDRDRFGDRGGVEARAQIRGHAEVGEPRGSGGHGR